VTAAATEAAADRAVLDRWWRAFVDTARLPPELPLVQGRLVRAVHRGDLPSGPVFVKVMTFPRGKDRLRYLLRALPGAHEATMLAATAAAGIACPEVVDVRSARRAGLPFRSMLVLRALVHRDDGPGAEARLGEEAALAARLLAAGIVHRDLHSGNFLRLHDGRLAVLDLQSASRTRRPIGRGRRLAAAVRLLQDRDQMPRAMAAAALLRSGLLRDEAEVESAWAATGRARARFLRGRIRRCLSVSTEFTRGLEWRGVLHRTRGELGEGRWWYGGRELRRAWLGQRAMQVLEARPPMFRAFLQKWWWFGGGGGLYAPRACSEEQIEAGVSDAIGAYQRHIRCIEGRGDRPGRGVVP
jgi:hypothetical protein